MREDPMPIQSSESLRPFIHEADIQARIDGLVREISDGMPGEEMVLVGILKKSFMFYADLMRRFHILGGETDNRAGHHRRPGRQACPFRE
jgi:hypoxanthine-guanine phosphoribosyltransferase